MAVVEARVSLRRNHHLTGTIATQKACLKKEVNMPERGELAPGKPITGKNHVPLFSEFFTSYLPFSQHSPFPISLHICLPVKNSTSD